MDATVDGFLVHSWISSGQFRAAGRLADGRSFAWIDRTVTASVILPSHEAAAARSVLTAAGKAPLEKTMETFDGSSAAVFEVAPHEWERSVRALETQGLHPRREHPHPAEDHRRKRGLWAAVRLEGPSVTGNRVDLVFAEPRVSPSAASVSLRWMSIDIETARDGEVRAVALVTPDGGEVLFRPDFPSEAGLLQAVSARVRTLDPDVITGWNVLDFDLAHLALRYTQAKLPFAWGRTDEPVTITPRTGGRTQAFIPGRQALDALRIVRMSGRRFEDQRLDTVAAAVLGQGKTVSLVGEAKLAELDRLYRDEPQEFCRYCRRDAELVLSILEKTGLGELTVQRAALTGVSLDLAWTSIPPFETLYGLELARRGILPPPKSRAPVSGAAGGMVLDPLAGLHDQVEVFDFRSLYPTIIRTFGIDPWAFVRAEGRPLSDVLVAPNGAQFLRERGILPQVLDGYFASRTDAQRRGDEVASHVYKILMNSFYGVLGAANCRYAATELAGAVTSFGRQFLHWTRDWFTARGARVLYGDTDSVFVQTSGNAAELSAELNKDLSQFIERQYQVSSCLELRAEKQYRRFLIPRLRGSEDDRGRAKGYAGWVVQDNGSAKVEIKGMEAVRSDWTDLAKRIQTELLQRIFEGQGPADLEAWRTTLLSELRQGDFDTELVYRKVLRRPAQDYVASQPPQVKAARLLGWTQQRGRISYVMTKDGPRPIQLDGLSPDYEHYIQHQIRPLWESLLDAAGFSLPARWDRQGTFDF